MLTLFLAGLLLMLPAPPPRVLVVTTDGWDAAQGRAVLLEDGEVRWGPEKVFVGRNGMAWDGSATRVLPMVGDGPIKKEGDGRAPAGVFRLGDTWRRSEAGGAYCVDDPGSPDYNRIVRLPVGGAKRWRSAERMTMYENAVEVAHNAEATRGAGSCIFIHAGDGPTAGCTALRRSRLADLLPMLEPGVVLVQMPRAELTKLRESWLRLPLSAALPGLLDPTLSGER